MNRKDLINYKTNETTAENQRIPLVLTFGSKLPEVQSIVHSRFPILEKSERLKQVFKEPPITAFKRDCNLMDMLVHKKYRKIFGRDNKGTSKCEKKCVICKYMKEGTKATSNQNRDYIFNDTIDCKTHNAVYGIHCEKCGYIVYVGETGTSLYERFQNHISCINKDTKDPIPRHFNGKEHSIQDLKIVGIEKIKKQDIHLRKIRESFWIKKMNTLKPNGLNLNLGDGNY